MVATGSEPDGNHRADGSGPDRGGESVAEALGRIGQAPSLTMRHTPGGPRRDRSIQYVVDSYLFAHTAKISRKAYPGPGQQPATRLDPGPGGLTRRERSASKLGKR